MTTQDAPIADNERPEDGERARKRLAIGLAPRRPTAKAAPLRPPDESDSSMQRWWPVVLLVATAVATLLLLAAKIANSPTQWSQVRQNVTSWLSGPQTPLAEENRHYRLQMAENFDTDNQLFANQAQENQWRLSVIPKAGVYRMEIWPGHVAWSTLGIQTRPVFKLETALAITPETPDGYGGLIARYQDPDNFYLFVVDGRGRFQAQLRQAGVLSVLQPWEMLDGLHSAGQNNRLALTDDGAVLQLYVNDTLAATVTAALPLGQIGVIGGAPAQSTAQINIDWLKLYDLPP